MVGEITQLLQRAGDGDDSVREPLYRLLYPELMRLARSHMRSVGTISLDAPGLLHDAYLRLCEQNRLPDTNRRTFFAYASKVMRSVIVDHLRVRGAAKRGASIPNVTLDTDAASSIFVENSVAEIENALAALEEIDARACRVVEMRYFGGMTEQDIADVLEISQTTVKRAWRRARAFLFEQLG